MRSERAVSGPGEDTIPIAVDGLGSLPADRKAARGTFLERECWPVGAYLTLESRAEGVGPVSGCWGRSVGQSVGATVGASVSG